MNLRFFFITLISVLAGYVSAQTYHYQLHFSDFTELKVVDGINVDYVCDAERAGLVEFYAESSVASAVIFEPSKSKLVIKLATLDSTYIKLPTVKVYSSHLTKVTNEGDSLLRVVSVAPCDQFKAKIIGNGTLSVHNLSATKLNANILSGHGMISVFGRCDDAVLKITGAGQIQADELDAKNVQATITGTGTINCFAESRLTVSGLGSGKLYYRGNPEIKKGFISKVKLFPVDKN